jgi:hypothetical protein
MVFGSRLNDMAPRDRFDGSDAEDDDDRRSGRALGTRRRFSEFDCPACSANNPFEFGNSDEVLCNWCGIGYVAQVDDEGVLRLKET